MNLFTSINEGLKSIHKNYQLLFIHFIFLFLLFFGIFIVFSIPLGILFIGFGIDLTDILRGNFIEIFISSLNLFKKFIIFALIFLLTLLFYIISIVALWIYTFSGTLGTIEQYLERGLIFSLREFHKYGKKYFWKVAILSIFSALLFFGLLLITGIIGNMSNYIIELLRQHSHTFSVFFSVFFYLTILLFVIFSFIVWISLTLIGYFIIVHKNLSAFEALKESKRFILNNPQILLRSFILFIIYLLTGGFVISLGSLFAIIPNVGTILAAIYQFLTQFVQVYLTLVIFATFFAYYLSIEKIFQRAIQDYHTSSEEAQEQAQAPLQQEPPQQSENQNS